MKNTVLAKVYSALATSFDIGVAYVFCSSETTEFALASTIPVQPSVAVEFLEQQQDAVQAEWAQGGAPRSRWKKIATQLRALHRAIRYFAKRENSPYPLR